MIILLVVGFIAVYGFVEFCRMINGLAYDATGIVALGVLIVIAIGMFSPSSKKNNSQTNTKPASNVNPAPDPQQPAPTETADMFQMDMAASMDDEVDCIDNEDDSTGKEVDA